MSNNQTSNIQSTQNQVDQVVDVMKANMTKVMERDDKVTDLASRSEAMQIGAAQFQVQSRNLKKKYWWKNLKWWLIIIAISVVVLALIIGLSVKPKVHTNSAGDRCDKFDNAVETCRDSCGYCDYYDGEE